jgi:SAM-dependent methyltransferase
MPVLTRRPVRQKRDVRKQLAREFLKGMGLTLKRTADIRKLGALEDGTLNFVVACGVLESCSDVLAAFQTMHRVLKPGGVLFLTVADGRDQLVTPLGHLAADYVHGPDQIDGVPQHAWTQQAWMELILAVQAGLRMELEAVRATRKEIITVLKKV